MTTYRLYYTAGSPDPIREVPAAELETLLAAYDFMTGYERIEQKFASICNNYLDLSCEVVSGIHRIRNAPAPSAMMYTSCEINRRILNFLSTLYAYHEFMDELEKDRHPKLSSYPFKSRLPAKLANSPALAFTWDLRHYYNHFGFALEEIGWFTALHDLRDRRSPAIQGIEMKAHRDRLQQTRFRWSAEAAAFLKSQDEKFDVMPILARGYAEWRAIHHEVRAHFETERIGCDSVIRRLISECARPKSSLCIAEDADVVRFDTGDLFFNNAVYVHPQFLDRVKFYLDNFMTDGGSKEAFLVLGPRELFEG